VGARLSFLLIENLAIPVDVERTTKLAPIVGRQMAEC
jgi:hypothetical protein